jgi:hypothetical protein
LVEHRLAFNVLVSHQTHIWRHSTTSTVVGFIVLRFQVQALARPLGRSFCARGPAAHGRVAQRVERRKIVTETGSFKRRWLLQVDADLGPD